MRARYSTLAGLVATLLFSLAACGDPPLNEPTEDTRADLPVVNEVSLPDAAETAEEDALPDGSAGDVTDPSDAPPDDTGQPSDASDGGTDAEQEGPQPDKTPPYVLSTTPAEGEDGVAVPFTVEIVFSEKMNVQTLNSGLIWIENIDGNVMPGSLEVGPDEDRVTWTAEFPEGLVPMSAYRIFIKGSPVSDPAGNAIEGGAFSAWFFTGDYPDTSNYTDLARKYAPTLRSETLPSMPQSQIPTRFDADGDYIGSNNAEWLAATESVVPAVYYAVTETRSHYFIHYMYFFPMVNDPASGAEHANGASGSMVVVEKASDTTEQRPVAVTNYFKSKQFEENRTYVTTESGIKGTQNAGFYNLEGVYDQAILFPNDRFESYITAGSHQSCLWIHEQNATFCNLEGFAKPSLKLLEFTPAGVGESAEAVLKGDGWPQDMDDVADTDSFTYDLVNADTSLWVRRLQTAVTFEAPLVSHETDPSRPPPAPAKGATVSSKFVDPTGEFDSAFGRPLWAWRFFPASGTLGDEWSSEHGEFGLDPAWYFWKRHRADSETTALESYDEAAGTGFSFDYCFHPKAKLDARLTDPLCL